MSESNKPLTVAAPPVEANGFRPLAHTGPLPYMMAEPNSGGPPGLTDGPSMSGLIHALRRRWLLAVTLALLGACLVILAVMQLLPSRYTAVALVQLSSRGDGWVFSGGAEHGEEFVNFKTNLAAQVKSPILLNQAIKSLKEDQKKDLALLKEHPDAVEWLQSAIKTDFKGPGILEIKLSSDRPGEVALLLNQIVKSLIDSRQQQEDQRRKVKVEGLRARERDERTDIERKERELRNLEARNQMDDLETAKKKYDLAMQSLGAVMKELLDNSKEHAKAKEEVRMLKDKRFKFSDKEVHDALNSSLDAQPLIVRRAKVLEAIFDIRQVAGDKSPAMIGALGQKAEVDRELDKLRVRVIEELRLSRIRDLETYLEILAQQESVVTDKKKGVEAALHKLNPANRPADMIAKAKEINEANETLRDISKKIKQYEYEPVASGRVTLQQEAVEPQAKDLSRHYKIAGAASIGLFALLLFGVAWFEFKSRKINGVEEVTHGLGMSLVGTLPNLPARARKANPAAPRDQWLQNQLTEAVDSIRTLLLHASRTEKVNVVMVTSAVGGEGKTSLATQLAASLARAWRKTLLVDGDLRNPAAHGLFDLPQEPGFSEVLRGDVTIADAVKPTSISRLWLMPAGQWDSHAVQALAQEGVKSLFEQLKQQYDFIIVDSCPVLPVADSLNLGQHVDGVIFAILRDVSRSPAVYAAQQKLNHLGIRTLGAVVIGETGGPATAAYQYPKRA